MELPAVSTQESPPRETAASTSSFCNKSRASSGEAERSSMLVFSSAESRAASTTVTDCGSVAATV